MELRVLVLFCSIFLSDQSAAQVSAQPPSWTVQPSVCIAQQPGDLCELIVKIETKNMPSELLCLFLDEQLLACSQQGYFSRKVWVEIERDALLELRNQSQSIKLSKKLLIKYFKAKEQRRRIRPPWSLF